jgi:hypothetical protein
MTKIAEANVKDIAEFLDASFIMGKLVLGNEMTDLIENKTAYMSQYAQMASFLSNPEEVKTVASRLSEYMGGLYEIAKYAYAIKGAFSEVLKKVGPEFGFASDVVILNSQVDGGTFTEVVFSKRLFRDVFTRPHGEFTHAIQWLLLALRFQKDFNIPKLYRYSVIYKSTVKFDTGKEKKTAFMWNYLVDCFEGAGEDYRENIVCQTYRCPQYMTNNLHTISTHSWLGNFLLARRMKGLKGGVDNKPGGHYDKGRVVTMPSEYVNRTVGWQPAYEQLNENQTLLRKAQREEMSGGYVLNGPTHPGSSINNNDDVEMT